MEGLQLKYFTLNPGKTDAFGAASRAAMLTYAKAIEGQNSALAHDLRDWVQRAAPRPAGGAPRIGHQWHEQGGIYVGIARGRDLGVDYHVILAELATDRIGWQAGRDWAKKISIEGHTDFVLPNRSELALLFANVKDLFEQEWYWSSEESAGLAESAWSQYFDYGTQGTSRKGSKLRARAVRRVPIE